MHGYTNYFHPRMIGLTDTVESIAAMAQNYAMYYKRIGDGEDYSMDHSTLMFLLDEIGRYRQRFKRDQSIDALVSNVLQELQ